MRARHFAQDDWLSGEDISMTGSGYDGWFWQTAVSAFAFADNVWYYLDKNGLNTWDGQSSGGEPVCGFADLTTAGLAYDCGALYFNTTERIYAYVPETGAVQTIAAPGEELTGSVVQNGVLTYQYRINGGYDTYGLPVAGFRWTDGGGYGYAAKEGGIELALDRNALVAAAQYSDSGRMIQLQFFHASGTVVPLPGSAVHLLSLSRDAVPRCKAVVISSSPPADNFVQQEAPPIAGGASCCFPAS